MQHTVVFVHGFGEDSRIWDTIIPAFQEDYNVLAPDIPGSGSNTEPAEGCSMESLADFINDMLVSKNIDSCTMIGHSMGGYITLAFAEKYPAKLKAFGLFHSTAYADNAEKKAAREKNIEFIRKHGSPKFLQQSVPKLFSGEFAAKNPDVVRSFIERYSNLSSDSLVHYTAAMMNRPDRTQVLKEFPRPVLFIMGEHDTAVPLEQGLKQCSIPEFSYIYIATHSGHLGMIEESDFCVKAVTEFLSGI